MREEIKVSGADMLPITRGLYELLSQHDVITVDRCSANSLKIRDNDGNKVFIDLTNGEAVVWGQKWGHRHYFSDDMVEVARYNMSNPDFPHNMVVFIVRNAASGFCWRGYQSKS